MSEQVMIDDTAAAAGLDEYGLDEDQVTQLADLIQHENMVRFVRFRQVFDPNESPALAHAVPLELRLPVFAESGLRSAVVEMILSAERRAVEHAAERLRGELGGIRQRIAEQAGRLGELRRTAAEKRRAAEDALLNGVDDAVEAERQAVEAVAAVEIAERGLEKLRALHEDRVQTATRHLSVDATRAVSEAVQPLAIDADKAFRRLQAAWRNFVALQTYAIANRYLDESTPRSPAATASRERKLADHLRAALER